MIEQLAKNTEKLEAAEAQRTQHFDSALADLENVIAELKEAHNAREEDAKRVRDDIRGLKQSLPQVLEGQKELQDRRMREVSEELKSLKALVVQRVNPNVTSATVGNYLRPSSGNTQMPGPQAGAPSAAGDENAVLNVNADERSKTPSQAYPDLSGRGSPYVGSGMPAARAAIPAWQRPRQPPASQASPPPTANLQAAGASEAASGSGGANSEQEEDGGSP